MINDLLEASEGSISQVPQLLCEEYNMLRTFSDYSRIMSLMADTEELLACYPDNEGFTQQEWIDFLTNLDYSN